MQAKAEVKVEPFGKLRIRGSGDGNRSKLIAQSETARIQGVEDSSDREEHKTDKVTSYY